MRSSYRWIVSIATCSILMACSGADQVVEPSSSAFRAESPVIVARQISVEELPGEFDETRTYVLRIGQAPDPESQLREMWAAGIRPAKAWLALDNRCMDLIGPRFTVEFVTDDPGIGDYGFDRGVGRLFCATTLTEYTVIEKP